MACGCKNKKKETKVQQNVDYTPNGGGQVRLGLKPAIRLPVRIPQAIDGQDILILGNKNQALPRLKTEKGKPPALVITGRNALVDAAHKEQLVEKWPKAFNVA